MMQRKEMSYAVIGGVIGAVLTMATGSFSPLGAQNVVKDVEFGTITCRKLRVIEAGVDTIICKKIWVVDSDNKLAVGIGTNEHGGTIAVGKPGKGSAEMIIDEHGAVVAVRGKDGKSGAAMSLTELGGTVFVYGKDELSHAGMGIDVHGGNVSVSGKFGKANTLIPE